MVKTVIQLHRSYFCEILRETTGYLELIFGLEMKGIDPKSTSMSLLTKDVSSDAGLNHVRGMPKTDLLMDILGVIFTKGSSATEEQVWQALSLYFAFCLSHHLTIVIMPRGQKSKFRARDKRQKDRREAPREVRRESRPVKRAEAPSRGENCASSPHGPVEPQSSPAVGLPSQSQKPKRVLKTTVTSLNISCPKFDESDESLEEETPSPVQAQPPVIDQKTIDNQALSLVQYLLHAYNVKNIVTKEDMLNSVIKNHEEHFPEILKKASELMILAFGIGVNKVNPSHHFILVRKTCPTSDASLSGEDIKPKTTLLKIILCVISLKGNRAYEEDIWEVLNILKVYGGKNHFIQEETQRVIVQDLIQEKYLEYRQVPNTKPPCYQVLWGSRALAEISKMDILTFLAKIHGTTPTAFPSFYEEAVRDIERSRAKFSALLFVNASLAELFTSTDF
ncbi:melanoma-associated antigen B4-like [Ctenodactylus gundi]